MRRSSSAGDTLPDLAPAEVPIPIDDLDDIIEIVEVELTPPAPSARGSAPDLDHHARHTTFPDELDSMLITYLLDLDESRGR